MKFLLSILCLFFAACLYAAEPFKTGDTFDPFTVKDQHDKDYTFKSGVKILVVSFDMGSGKKANKWFAEKPADFLSQKQALFLSDIHSMPGVGRMFALPKMRKYPHCILLGDSEHLLDRYPKQQDKLTILRFDEAAHITAIEFVDPDKDLDSVFTK